MAEKADRKTRNIALIVAATMFMVQLDGTALATALPEMSREFQVSPVDMSLAITIYVTCLVGFLPASAWLADNFGARRVLVWATVLFALSSILCSVSTSFWEFIAARALQGVGASALAPIGRLILLRTTPKQQLVSAIATASAPMLLAPTFGPAIGGFIVTYASWEWIFLLNVPIAFAVFITAWRFLPKLEAQGRTRLDIFGLLLVASTLVALVVGLNLVRDEGKEAVGALLLAASLPLGFAAVRHLRTHITPIIPLHPIAKATFRIATVSGGAFARLPLIALLFILPVMFQTQLGMNAFEAGLLLLVLNFGDLLLKPMARIVFRAWGFPRVLVLSSLAGGATVIAIADFGATTAQWLMIAVLTASGMARSLLFTGITTLAYADLEEHEMSAANVIINMVQQVMHVVGVSLSALMLALGPLSRGESTTQLILSDFRVTLWFFAAVSIAAGLSMLRLAPDAGAVSSGRGRAGAGIYDEEIM
jgi:EmrB/QacA subfamily drug resistance transporter